MPLKGKKMEINRTDHIRLFSTPYWLDFYDQINYKISKLNIQESE